LPTPNFFYLIGKPIIEKYGRFKGRIIALDFDTNGELNNIFYINGGVILSKNRRSVIIEDDKVLVVNPDIVRANELLSKINFLRLQLDTLEKMKELSPNSETYLSLVKHLMSEYEELKSEISNLIRRLGVRKRNIEKRKNKMEQLFYWLNVAKNSKNLDNRVYMESFEVLDREIFRLNSEWEEIEYTILTLSSKANDIDELFTKHFSPEEVVNKPGMGEDPLPDSLSGEY
jgi:DNA repair exonuclease SbcCD ATPase subunit